MFRRKRTDEDFHREIESHLLHEADAQAADDRSDDQARAAARAAFGNVALTEEAYYVSHHAMWWDRLRLDVRWSWRGLRRSPVFALVVVASLALGVGATTALFRLVDVLLLRELPVLRPAELVRVERRPGPGLPPKDIQQFPVAVLDSIRRLPSVAAVAGMVELGAPVVGAGGDTDYSRSVTSATGNFLDVLGVSVRLGRTSADCACAVIADRYWQAAFNRRPDILSQSVIVNGQSYPIVGVARPEFTGMSLDRSTDIWLLQLQPAADQELMPIVRLAGSSIDGATAAIDAIFLRADPSVGGGEGFVTRLDRVGRGLSSLRGQYETVLLALLALSAVALLATCANVGTLVGGRHATRAREMSVRAALGAGRLRLVTQLLIESTILAVAGAVGAAWIARFGVSALLGLLPTSTIPDTLAFHLDLRVLAFMAVITCVSVCLFALVPAWRAASNSELATLRTGNATAPHAVRRFSRTSMVGISGRLICSPGLIR